MASPSKAAPTAAVPQEWQESCSCFLVLCDSDLDDDPDQRLRLYTNAVSCAAKDAHAFRLHALNADQLHHVDPTAATTSSSSSSSTFASTSSPVSAVSTWVDVLLTGVQDPWSRIRSVAADGLCATVMAVVTEPNHTGARGAAEEDDDTLSKEDDSFVVVSASSTPHRRSSVASGVHSVGGAGGGGGGGGGNRHRASSARTTASLNMTSLSGVSSAGGQSPHPAKRLSFLAANSRAGTPLRARAGAARGAPLATTPTKQQWQTQKTQRRFLMDIFSKLFVKWARASHWYAREGMLRVWEQLLPVVVAMAEDNVTKMLVQKVCLPALTDPQVPVRDAASTLLGAIAGASPELATVAMERVRQSLEALAAETSAPTTDRADDGDAAGQAGDSGAVTTKADEAAAYAAEGYLKSLVKLCAEQDAHHLRQLAQGARSFTPPPAPPPALEAFAPLLVRFAPHPASSVRQCVAAALGTHSQALFALLVRSLASTATYHSSSWQFQETVLMALSEHLRYYLAQDTRYALDLLELFAMPDDRAAVAVFRAGGAVSASLLSALSALGPDLDAVRQLPSETLTEAIALARKHTTMEQCLGVLCEAAQSSRFEVARMSLQVIPLFVQLWVRFSTHVADLLHIVHHRVPATVFVQAAVDALHRRRRDGNDESASEAEAIVAALAAQPAFYFYANAVLAPLWWYLTVRFYGRLAPAAGGEDDGMRHESPDEAVDDGKEAMRASLAALVRQYGTPLYWLEYISEASRTDTHAATTPIAVPSSAAEALRLWTPLLPHLCSVNLLVATYFGGYLSDHPELQDGEALGELLNRQWLVLEPPLWAALLATGPPSVAASLRTAVPTRQYLHVGLDFVSGLWWRRRLASSSASSSSSSLLRLQRLIPVWVGALTSLQTHQQCLLLSMTRTALGVDALPERVLGSAIASAPGGPLMLSLSGAECGGASGSLPHAFRFVYRSTFRAPAMLDGGEDVPLGYTWLRWCFPVELDAPSVAWLYTNPNANTRSAWYVDESEDATPPCPAPLALDPQVEDAVDAYVLKTLYVDPGVEPSVLREVRLLMSGLCLLAHDSEVTTQADWWHETVSAVFVRLDRIGPNWATIATSAASNHINDRLANKDDDDDANGGDDWDDWDNDSEEDEGVQAISVPQEVREAKSLLSQLSAATGRTATRDGGDDDKLHALLLDKPEAEVVM